MQNIPEVMSCYRVTGQGVWTSKSKKEQARLNNILKISIFRSVPFKYKFYIFWNIFQRILCKIQRIFRLGLSKIKLKL